ncbi:MAG TPA: ion channel [Amnibacterium sp.]|jgi:hypothetical protein|uniref:potassium channel family protein n=1 Tax=Amnibacterium sp. TaxID=1872496 RepID=UPI002F94156E
MSVRDADVKGRRPGAVPPPDGAGWYRWRAVVVVARLVVVVAVLLLVYIEAPWEGRLDLSLGAQLLGWLAVLVVVIWLDVRSVLRSRRPWQRAAEGAVLSIALLLLPFASAYVLLQQNDAASFSQPLTRVDGLYFAVTVFSTVGFGDITPVTETARVLVTVQIVVDLLLVGVITKVLLGVAQLQNKRLKSTEVDTTRPEGDQQENFGEDEVTTE